MTMTTKYSPDNPSPTNIKCEMCDNQTNTGICADCASRLHNQGKLAEWERSRKEPDET